MDKYLEYINKLKEEANNKDLEIASIDEDLKVLLDDEEILEEDIKAKNDEYEGIENLKNYMFSEILQLFLIVVVGTTFSAVMFLTAAVFSVAVGLSLALGLSSLVIVILSVIKVIKEIIKYKKIKKENSLDDIQSKITELEKNLEDLKTKHLELTNKRNDLCDQSKDLDEAIKEVAFARITKIESIIKDTDYENELNESFYKDLENGIGLKRTKKEGN